MQMFADGKAVISYVTSEKLKELGATYDMTGSCIDVLRKIESVEICAFLKQHDDGSYKLSLRAKTYADVNRIASALGGGGHIRAAGATLRGSLSEVLARVVSETEKELKRCERGE